MNISYTPTFSSPSDRSDLATAKTVDRAIVIASEKGRAAAADYLARAGVNFAVIVRVLSEPSRRRIAAPR